MSELPRFVLGIDPGKTTGVALYDLLTDHLDGAELAEDEVGRWLEFMIAGVRPVVACEAFVITQHTARNSQAPWSLEIIGVARHLAATHGCRFELQAASAAKAFATDARLKALGWWRPGKGHMADAQRHTLLFLVKNGWWDGFLDDKRSTE
jgi:hypothetical protein